MKFDHAVHVSSRLVALSGLLALLLTLESAYWLVIPAIMLAAAGIFSPRFSKPALTNKAVSALAVAALAFSVLDFFYLGGSLILAGADFLVLLLCLKVFSLEKEKDYYQLFGVSFFLLLASTGLSTDIYFLLAFLMFFVTLTWVMILLTVKGESEGIGGPPPRWRVGGGFFAGTAALTLAATACTLTIFLIIPRVGIGFFSKRAGGLLKVAGFSDRVDLGSMGEVKLDPTAVMRVELPGVKVRPEGGLYFRGRAFDYYTGTAWEDTLTARTDLYRGPSGMFYIRPDEAPPGEGVVQNIALEPLDTTTIFALYPAYAINAGFRQLWVDPAEGLHLPYPAGNRLHYTAYSAPGRGLSRRGYLKPGRALRPELAIKYLQLPRNSEDLTALALRVTADAKTPFEKAEKARLYLGSGYRYTLDPPRDARYSPIDDFLFHSRAGYCEHFATAMVLMLRAAGIPSRMVTGFSGGQWNDYGSYLLIRESDAHTWVEAYLPGEGWVTFDPTPEASAENVAPVLSGLTNFMDYVRYSWDRYIVYYNLQDQVRAARGLSSAYQTTMEGLKSLALPSLSKATAPGKTLPLVLTAFLVAAFAAYVLWRVLKGPGSGKKRATVQFYEEMARVLRKKGAVREGGVTPMEFAKAVAGERGGDYEGVVYITEIYNRVRFGDGRVSRTEQDRVKEILDGLKKL